MTPTPQKFVDEARKIMDTFIVPDLEKSIEQLALALQTSHDEGVREAEKEKNDLLLVISNLIDVINKHAIHGPLCVGSKNYCECGLLDALSASQAIRFRQRSSN